MGRYERGKRRDADTLLNSYMQAANSLHNFLTTSPRQPPLARVLLTDGDEAADVLAVLNRAEHLKCSQEDVFGGIFEEVRDIAGAKLCVVIVRKFEDGPRTRLIYNVEFIWPMLRRQWLGIPGRLDHELKAAGLYKLRAALSGNLLRVLDEALDGAAQDGRRRFQRVPPS